MLAAPADCVGTGRVTCCQRINLSPGPPYMGQQCMNVLQGTPGPGRRAHSTGTPRGSVWLGAVLARPDVPSDRPRLPTW